MIKLVKSLRFTHSHNIAFVGAGGKTTALFQLARELPPPVIVTGTTHFGTWQIPLADEHLVVRIANELGNFNPRGVTLVTGKIEKDRIKGVQNEVLSWLREVAEKRQASLLIEADGSRQKPLKAPAQHEPAIPEFVDVVVVVAGLSALGKTIDEENVHRPEIFTRLSGLQPGEVVSKDSLVSILAHREGGLKNIPPTAQRVALLNQADTLALQAQSCAMIKPLLSAYEAVIIASLQEEKIHAVHEQVAGIILAAGESQRFGQPKQLLDWRGEPFVRAVAKRALEAGLSPVIVVTGSHAAGVSSSVSDLPLQIVHNQDWQSGQASSIREGVQTLTPGPSSDKGDGKVGGAIFLLADQPHITPVILHALVEEHASTLASIVAPMVLDQRANPVLFDQNTFPDLMNLEGDMGGRRIFSKHKVTYLPWHDDALLLDVDTPEHYQRLKELLE